jgi:hypothetical protein
MTELDDDALATVLRHTVAIAVQDAAVHMRHVNMIAAVAMGLAQQMIIAGDNGDAAKAATDATLIAQKMIDGATSNFIAVCNVATGLGGAPPIAGPNERS